MGKLVLVRHGQSIWNLENRFTGWIDVSLSKKGLREAKDAGKKLKNFKFDLAFTSTLMRAQDTLFEILEVNNFCEKFMRVHETSSDWYEHFEATSADKNELKIFVSDKLNERYYGDLQGLNKEETAKKFGAEKVHIWRRSFDVPPPNGESLEMTSKRTLPYFEDRVIPELKKGKDVIIAAHGNSLRSIIMFLEKMTPEQILQFEIKTGVPYVYEFDDKFVMVGKKVLI